MKNSLLHAAFAAREIPAGCRPPAPEPVEVLENRIAPAFAELSAISPDDALAMLSGTTFGAPSLPAVIPAFSADGRTATFTDVDGDLVTVKTTAGTFDASNFAVFAVPGAVPGGGQFSQLVVSDAEFAGANITITAKRTGLGGDGLVNLGFLNATGVDLGKVSLKGDLGRFALGDGTGASAVSLTVRSMGLLGESTQAGIAPSLTSEAAGELPLLTISGDVLAITLNAPTLGTAKIAGSVKNAVFDIAGAVAALTVSDDVTGSTFTLGGAVGSIVPGPRPGTYKVLGGIKFNGDVEASTLSATGNVSLLTIGGDVLGSTVLESTGGFGSIAAGATPGSVKLNGGLIVRGDLSDSTINSTADVSTLNLLGRVDMAAVTLGADAGQAKFARWVEGLVFTAAGNVGTATAGGSFVLSTFDVSGDIGTLSAGTKPGSVKIAGGFIAKGSVIDSAIRTDGDLAKLTVARRLEGSTVSARGDLAPADELEAQTIGALSVRGQVSESSIFAGYDVAGMAVNADVQVGKVNANGQWIASNLVAGVRAGMDLVFGTADDRMIGGGNAIVSKIASVVVGGQILGTVGGTDGYGVVAQEIGVFRVSGTKLPFTPGAGNDLAGFPLGSTLDTRTREASLVPEGIFFSGGEDDDEFFGGDGDDTLLGNGGHDTLVGGAGNDWIAGGSGDDSLTGGLGEDTLIGGDGYDFIRGDEGNDTLIGGLLDDILEGGAGDDLYLYNFGDADGIDTIDDASGTNDRLDFTSSAPQTASSVSSWQALDVNGNGNVDALYVEFDFNNYVVIFDYFDDTANTAAASGPGSGLIESLIFTDDPNMTFSEVVARLTGMTFIGGDGDDSFMGGDGDDTLLGNGGNDTLVGGAGNDWIAGGSGLDSIEGGMGEDTLEGGADEDILFGNEGNDVLMCGPGYDTLIGGAGDDTYHYNYGDHFDLIIDESGTNDRIDFTLSFSSVLLFQALDFNGTGNVDMLYIAFDGINALYIIDYFDDTAATAAASGPGSGSIESLIFTDDPNMTFSEVVALVTGVTFNGGDGDDSFIGGFGDDTLLGNGGNDTLVGGGGNDEIVGGAGDDHLQGGAGDDLYIFNFANGDGFDLIDDASGANDRLDFTNIATSSVTAWMGIDLNGNGNVDTLYIEPENTYAVFISNYFDDTAITVSASGPGSGLIESLIFTDDASVTFSEVKTLV